MKKTRVKITVIYSSVAGFLIKRWEESLQIFSRQEKHFFIASKEDAEIQCESAENIIKAVKKYLNDNFQIVEDSME